MKQGSEVSCIKGRTGALCCSGCKYLGPNGCTTKNLACKLWFCDEILADKNTNTKYKAYFEEAKIILMKAYDNGINIAFALLP